MEYTFGAYRILTDAAQNRQGIVPNFCECPACRGFRAAAAGAAAETQSFFRQLGLELCCPDEVLGAARNPDGSFRFLAWYYFRGVVLSGRQMAEANQALGHGEMIPAAPGLWAAFEQSGPAWPAPADYIHMDVAIDLPWVLEEPYE